MEKKKSACLRWGVVPESRTVEREIHKEFGSFYGEGSSFEAKDHLIDGTMERMLILKPSFINYLSNIKKLGSKFRVCVSSNKGISWRIWDGYREGKKDDE